MIDPKSRSREWILESCEKNKVKDPTLMEKTIKEYRKENYYAKISGVDPNLDYIETYNTTITNTVYVPKTDKKNFIIRQKKMGV